MASYEGFLFDGLLHEVRNRKFGHGPTATAAAAAAAALFGSAAFGTTGSLAHGLNLSETSNSICLSWDLPGVRGKDLRIQVEHGVLCIKGVRVFYDNDGAVVKKHKFAQKFAVDTDVVDMTQANADISHGVLVIKAPKKRKPTTIKIPLTENGAAIQAGGEASSALEESKMPSTDSVHEDKPVAVIDAKSVSSEDTRKEDGASVIGATEGQTSSEVEETPNESVR